MKKISAISIILFIILFGIYVLPGDSYMNTSGLKLYSSNAVASTPAKVSKIPQKSKSLQPEEEQALSVKNKISPPTKNIKGTDPASAKSAYAPNQIIVKFKPEVAEAIDNLDTGNTAGVVMVSGATTVNSLPASINNLNKRYKAKKIKKLYVASKEQREKLNDVEFQVGVQQKFNIQNNYFDKQEKRMAERFKRAPKKKKRPDLDRTYIIEVEEGQSVEELVSEFKKDNNVEYAEPNFKMKASVLPGDPPDDPYYHSQNSFVQGEEDLWGVKRIQSHLGWQQFDLNHNGVYDNGEKKPGEGIIVAVVDTGVDYNHADLHQNMWDDGAGHVGYDFVNDDQYPMDDQGHGTHCAGVIAAMGDNNQGIIGIAPEAKIMAVKALSADISGYVSDLAQAIIFAADNGADVISNSWGASSPISAYPQTLIDAIEYAQSAGCLVVFAAGNEANDAVNYGLSGFDDIILVGASDSDDQRADFSNWGTLVDVAAPGVNILSLRAEGTDLYAGFSGYTPGANFVPQGDPNAEYYYAQGTSMACPYVSGLAAVLLSQNENLTSEEVKALIEDGSDIFGQDLSTPDKYIGKGRINMIKTLQLDDPTADRVDIVNPINYGWFYNGYVAIEANITGSSYTIEYGEGTDPSSWTMIESNSVSNGVVYYNWDAQGLSDGLYSIKVSSGDGSDRVIVGVVNDPALRTGFPIHFQGTQEGPVIMADLDNNGSDEMILTYSGGLEVVEADGSIWDHFYLDPQQIDLISAPVVGDLDNDGDQEIVVSYLSKESNDSIIAAFDYEGTRLWDYSIPGYDWGVRPVIADVNNDDIPEIIVWSLSETEMSYASYMTVLSNTGGYIDREVFNERVIENIVVGDINNDEQSEIIVQLMWNSAGSFYADKGNFIVYDNQLNKLFEREYDSPPGEIVLADMNGDAVLDIVVAPWEFDGDTPVPSQVSAYDSNGLIVWQSTPTEGTIIGLSAGNLDSDDDLEIVARSLNGPYTTTSNNLIYIFDNDGSVINIIQDPKVGVQDPEPSRRNPIIADVDGDGINEILASGYAWNIDGSVVPAFPKLTNGNTWGTDYYAGIAPAIGDIDGDYDLDMAVVIRDDQNECELFAWSLDTPYHPEKAWPLWLSDPQNTAALKATQPLVDTEPPTLPTGLTARALSHTSIELTWNASTDNVGVAGYRIYRGEIEIATSSGTAYTDTNLQPSTEYTYWVLAYDEAGNQSERAYSVIVRTDDAPDTQAPTVPSALSAEPVSTTEIHLTWNTSTDNVGVAGYKIYREGQEIETTQEPSYSDEGLQPSTSYRYQVLAYDAAGNESGLSATVSATTHPEEDTQAPSRPWGLTGSVLSSTSVVVNWNEPTDNVGVVGYTFYRDGDEIGTTTMTNYIDTGLEAATEYSYYVKAFDAAGNVSGRSSSLFITTDEAPPDTEAPSMPEGLDGSASSSNEIIIEWDPSSDNVGVAGYKVIRDSNEIGTTVLNSYTDSGLLPGITYSYRVIAYDAAGNESQPSSALGITTPLMEDTTPPSVPTGLAPYALSSTAINVIWNPSEDDVAVEGYKVYRNGTEIATVPTTSLMDEGLTPGTTYHYQVLAFDAAGNESTRCDAVSATTMEEQDTEPPSVPTEMSAEPLSSTEIEINWNASTDNVGVAGYRIYRNGNVIEDIIGTVYIDSGLEPSTPYTYRVLAYDAAGNESALTSEVTATTRPDNDGISPTAPENLSAHPESDSVVSLTWDASTDDRGVAGYKVYRDDVEIVTTVTTSYLDTGLQAERAYTYQVMAYDTSGNESGLSTPAIAITPAAPDTESPSVPTGLSADPISSTEIELNWNTSADNVEVVGYRIYRNGDEVATVSDTTFVDASLNPGTSYSYQVLAYDAAGNTSALCSSVSARTENAPDTTSPSIPEGLRGEALSSREIRLTWNISTDNVAVTGYTVYRDGQALTTVSQPTFVDTGLQPLTTYRYEVSAHDAAGNNSEPCPSVRITTQEAVDMRSPTRPEGLTGQAVSYSTIELSWNPATDDIGVEGYLVYRDGVEIATTGSTAYVDTGLNAVTQYSYYVYAFDAAGNISGRSSSVFITTLVDPENPDVGPPDDRDPVRPSGLVGEAVSFSTVELSWPPTTDNVGVAGYIVFRDGDEIGQTEGTSYVDTGLVPLTEYSYYIKAFDAAGNISGRSSSVFLTTPADPDNPNVGPPDEDDPRRPGGLAGEAVSSSAIQLSWPPGTDNVGVTGYIVFRDGDEIATTEQTSYLDTGLSPMTQYGYYIKAFDAAGNISSRSASIFVSTISSSPDTQAPTVPTGLTATPVSSSRIDLAWMASSDNVGVVGYRIYRNGDQITTVSTTSYMDPGLEPSTSYTYRVMAYDAAGNESGLTAAVSATTESAPDIERPSVPTGLNAETLSPTSIELIWAASTDNVGVLEYKVYRNGTEIESVSETVYIDEALEPAITYRYQVRAVDVAGNESALSEAVSVTTPAIPDTQAPTVPLGLSPYALSSTVINVIWNPSEDNVGVEGYKVYRDGNEIAVTGTTDFADEGLSPGTTYSYQVLSFDGAGNESALSSPVSATTLESSDTQAPTVPASVQAHALSYSSIEINWMASEDNEGVTGYKVFRGDMEVATTGTTTYTDSGLEGSTTYTYQVLAYDAAGNESALSSPASATTDPTPDLDAPSVPTGLTTNPFSSTKVELRWDRSTDNVGVNGYNIYRDGELIASTYNLMMIDENLQPATTYSYQISAYDIVGNESALCPAVTATTKEAVVQDTEPPTLPSQLDAYAMSSTEVHVSWGFSSDNVGVAGYKVYRDDVRILTTTLTSFVDTGLDPETTYHYQVLAYDAAGNQSEPASVTVTTEPASDTLPPSVPTELGADPLSDTQIELHWNASVDNVGVVGYKVYRGGEHIRTVTETSFVDDSLMPSTTYSYQVLAYDAAGNESRLTSAVSVTTEAVPDTQSPTVPTGLTADPLSTTEIELNWNASTDNVEVYGYRIFRNGDEIGTTAGLTYTDTGLSPGTSYSYRVLAYDVSGNESDLSVAVSATTEGEQFLDTRAPIRPSGLAGEALSDSSIALSWPATTDNVGVAGYIVYRDGDEIERTAGLSFTDVGLEPVTEYSYYIKAFDAAGNVSGRSSSVFITTLADPDNPDQGPADTDAPSRPGGLVGEAVSDESIELYWNATTDNVGVTGYIVYRDGDEIGTTPGLYYVDTGLMANTEYSYYIKAYDAAQNISSRSSSVFVRTLVNSENPDQGPLDTTAPFRPEGLTGTALSETSVQLSWTEPSDDVGVAGYFIYRDRIMINVSEQTVFVDTGLFPGTTYNYYVQAFDAAGNISGRCTSVDVTTTTGQGGEAIIPIAHSPIIGDVNAPITLVAFIDFQCPSCQHYLPGVLDMIDRNPGKVKLVIKQFPLPYHDQARSAAKAGLAAAEQGKYREMVDALLDNGSYFNDDVFVELAGQIGLNVDLFLDNYRNLDYVWEDYINKDIALGLEVDVTGTPNFYINGVKSSHYSGEELEQEILSIENQP